MGEPEPLDDASLGLSAGSGDRVRLAFGIYSPTGLERALRTYGTLGRLEAHGVGPLEVRIGLADPFRPRIQIWSQSYGAAVVDLEVCQQSCRSVGITDVDEQSLLYLESVTLEHPGRVFSWSRPPLPEQEKPGLSAAREVLELLLLMARRIGAVGMALTPSSFHAAWIYSRHFRFVSGESQGNFDALRRAEAELPLWLLSWAVSLDCIREVGTGAPVRFVPTPMVCGHTPLSRHFRREEWKGPRRQAASRQVEVDCELLAQRLPWDRMPPAPVPDEVLSLLPTAVRSTLVKR